MSPTPRPPPSSNRLRPTAPSQKSDKLGVVVSIDDAPAAGRVGGYNAFWYEFGSQVGRTSGRLSSLIRRAVGRRRSRLPRRRGPAIAAHACGVWRKRPRTAMRPSAVSSATTSTWRSCRRKTTWCCTTRWCTPRRSFRSTIAHDFPAACRGGWANHAAGGTVTRSPTSGGADTTGPARRAVASCAVASSSQRPLSVRTKRVSVRDRRPGELRATVVRGERDGALERSHVRVRLPRSESLHGEHASRWPIRREERGPTFDQNCHATRRRSAAKPPCTATRRAHA